MLKTLLEAKCLPQILSGASAGSLMCSFISVRTDQEVLRDLCVPEAEVSGRCECCACVTATATVQFFAQLERPLTSRPLLFVL